MNKYDFGYELHPDSTVEWAFNQIVPNTTILELGPFNGNLIYHLTKDKGCIADIVEMDVEAGHQAAVYARKACIGPIEGNIERKEWLEILSGEKYDYIVILDVLEHVRNPREVLLGVTELLKDEGKLLLSIPNIAHNSILINLLQNRFEYTEVGLLDDTHIHFYTYESAKKLLWDAGMITVQEEVKQKRVGTNEVNAYYGELPQNVEAYLKTRPLGTAYQFLFTAKKGMFQEDIPLEYIQDKEYELVIFNEHEVLNRVPVNPRDGLSLNISLENEMDAIRLDPLNRNCIISNFSVYGCSSNGDVVQMIDIQHTGTSFGGKIIFYDDDPQIYIKWEKKISKLCVCCTFVCFDDEGLRIVADQVESFKMEQKCKYAELEDRFVAMEQKYNGLLTYLSEHRAKSVIKILRNRGFEGE